MTQLQTIPKEREFLTRKNASKESFDKYERQFANGEKFPFSFGFLFDFVRNLFS